MSPTEQIHEGKYTHGKPFVKVRIVLINPDNLRQTTIEVDMWIDTGFDGGIHIAGFHEVEANGIGLGLFAGNIGVAGGRTEMAKRCFAYLQKIGNKEIPPPGIEAELVFHGSDRHGLLGLEVLRNWIITFNGPNEIFDIKKPTN